MMALSVFRTMIFLGGLQNPAVIRLGLDYLDVLVI